MTTDGESEGQNVPFLKRARKSGYNNNNNIILYISLKLAKK